MKKTELTNWIAALGIGSGVAFHSGVDAQETVDVPRAENTDTPVDRAALAKAVKWVAPVYVVINHEEQYSIWPSELKIPEGWGQIGREQTLEQAAERLAGRVGELRFQVVINHEEQYSVWPASHALPSGFQIKVKSCQIVECARQISG